MSYNNGLRYVAYDAANGDYEEFETKEDAHRSRVGDCIDTVKIEWEE